MAGCDDTELSLPDGAVSDAGATRDATSADASAPCEDPSACRGDVSISQTTLHHCAIRAGALFCWGTGEAALGLPGVPEPVEAPVRVGTASGWELIAAGWDHTCGVESGIVLCWGDNASGELGDGTQTTRVVPSPVIEAGAQPGWTALAAGLEMTCGIRAGALHCWGKVDFSAEETAAHASPQRIGTDSDWTHVAVGKRSICGLRSGRIFCWGDNNNGSAGQGHTDRVPAPAQVGEAADWDALFGGSDTSCGLRQGALFCWGENLMFQAGQIDTSLVVSPRRVGTEVGWTDVDAWLGYSCGIREGGLYCWGKGVAGEPSQHPSRVGASSSWTEISVGRDLSCGIRDGEVACFDVAPLPESEPPSVDLPL